MKKLIFACFIFFAYNVNAQNKTTDSLKTALKTAKHDTTRCEILAKLSETASETEWPIFNEQLRILSEKNSAELKSIDPLRKVYLKYYAIALNNNGILNDEKGDIPNALKYYFKSIKIHEELDNKKYIASSFNNIGFVYKKQGDIKKALEYYFKSLKIKEEIGDKEKIAISLSNIGGIFMDQGDLIKSLEYYEKSLKLLIEVGDKESEATLLNNIGTVYKSKEDFQKALDYFERSLNLREEIGDKSGIANSYGNLANVYKKLDNVDKALEYHLKALKIYEVIDEKTGIAGSSINIGSMLMSKNKLDKALIYSNKGMETSKRLGFPKYIYRSAIVIKNILIKQNKYKEAFEMYELEMRMLDSINNMEVQKATVKKQMQSDFERKELETKLEQDKKDAVTNEILKQKEKERNYFVAGFAVVLISALLILRAYKQKQKANVIITEQKKLAEFQKNIIEEKHKEITDSINYAERIQRSFLATKELLDENLNCSHAELDSASDEALNQVQGENSNYFVYFKPKDIVSGDFYWADTLSNGNFALVTADSTGHGVPGAIMSLLNITSLENAIKETTEPAQILNLTRQTIITRLKKDGSADGGKDGMDCSLVSFDFKNKKLYIAAANNPVWIVKNVFESDTIKQHISNNKQLIEFKPDKMPVGKHDRDTELFTQHVFELQKGDIVYTLTDGFPDQFGGEKGKKFMSKSLKELLLANAHLSMNEQKELLDTTFKNWVGNLEQVDDVCVIGIRV